MQVNEIPVQKMDNSIPTIVLKMQLKFVFCFSTAIKGKILSIIQVLAPKGYSIQFNVSRVIVKDGFLFRGSVVQIWSQYNYTRFTHSFSTLLEMGRRYVFLGHGNRTKGFTIGWAWAWPRDKHVVDKLRKWKTQSRKRNSVG